MAYSAELCGSKLRSKLGGVLNESAATSLLTSNSSFAKRQMEKMGWTEGTGLGKNRDGAVEHIRVHKREEEQGLGREKVKSAEMANTWWADSVGETLARLRQKASTKSSPKEDKKAKKKGKKKDKKDKKTSKEEKKKASKDTDSAGSETIKLYTDEELFAATGGARFGMRAQRRAEAKWARTESGSQVWDLEEKAKEQLEWNGLGKAKVVVNGVVNEGQSASVGGQELVEENEAREQARKAKKRKRQEDEIPADTKELHDKREEDGGDSIPTEITPLPSEDDETDPRARSSSKTAKKKKKRRKEEKKKAKKSGKKKSKSNEA